MSTRMVGWFSSFFSVWMILLWLMGNSGCSVQAAHSRRRRNNNGSDLGMRSSRRYDRSVTTFDPTGRLRQVEHGWNAAERGHTVAAAVVGDAIYVVLVEQVVPAPHESTSSSLSTKSTTAWPKVQPILLPSSASSSSPTTAMGGSLWVVLAGLAGDAQFFTEQLRSVARQHVVSDGGGSAAAFVSRAAADYQHALTVRPGRRPLGVTALVLGHEHEPRLFRCSAGGIREDCRYCAAGQQHAAVQAALAKCYDPWASFVAEKNIGASGWHYEIVERMVRAVQEGLGFKVARKSIWKKWRNDEDRVAVSVWVFPKPLSSTNDGKYHHHQPICFTGIVDDESMSRVQAFWMHADKESDAETKVSLPS